MFTIRNGLLAFAVSAVLVAAATTGATAATLSLESTGGASRTLSKNFSLNSAAYKALAGGVGVGSTLTAFDQATKNASNGLSLKGPARVTFTYLGKEAGFTNFALGLSDTVLFSTATATVGQKSSEFTVAKGPLDFSFRSGTGNKAFGLANDGGYFGVTPVKGVGIGYSAFLSDKLVPKNGQSVLAFFDDSGAGPDMDFDDIGVRIDVVPVPLPAAGWMLLAGLGAMGAAARKRKAAAA
jgi:hypothetical protein